MTSLSAQALIDEWNNGMNLVEILEIMVPQVCTSCFIVTFVHHLHNFVSISCSAVSSVVR